METEKQKREGNKIDHEALKKSIEQKNKILKHNSVVHKGHNTQ